MPSSLQSNISIPLVFYNVTEHIYPLRDSSAATKYSPDTPAKIDEILFSIPKFTLIILSPMPHIFPFGLVVIPRLRLISNCVWISTDRFPDISLTELPLISGGWRNIGRF